MKAKGRSHRAWEKMLGDNKSYSQPLLVDSLLPKIFTGSRLTDKRDRFSRLWFGRIAVRFRHPGNVEGSGRCSSKNYLALVVNHAIGTFPNCQSAEQALVELRETGFAMIKISVLIKNSDG